MTEKKGNVLWPDVSNISNAKKASLYGVWASLIPALMTALAATWAIGAGKKAMGFIDAFAFLDVFIFCVVAFYIYKESRFAAVFGLVIFLIEKVYQVFATGRFDGWLFAIILTTLFVACVRGTYALHRLRNLANIESPDSRPA